MKTKPHLKKPFKWTTRESVILGVVILFIGSWLIGKSFFLPHIDPFFEKAWPAAESYVSISENHTKIIDKNGEIIGYMSKGMSEGYSGPLTVGVAIDLNGDISSLAVLEYRETPSFFQKVINSGVLKKLVERKVQDSLAFKNYSDAVTGATYTYNAIVKSVEIATHEVGTTSFNINYKKKKQEIIFGLPEVILILLFSIAFIRRKYTKGKVNYWLRWATLITGLVFLGFIYNRSYVLSDINMILLGYLPTWQSHLYWYILIVGLLLFKSKKNWNTYCYDFCPFGACQEVLASVGKAKSTTLLWPKTMLWLHRSLAITAVSMALLFRNPGFSSFEIFGTLFNLNGSSYQFGVLAIILLSSIFIYRPWCNFLCPLHKRTLEGLFDRIRGYVLILYERRWKKS